MEFFVAPGPPKSRDACHKRRHESMRDRARQHENTRDRTRNEHETRVEHETETRLTVTQNTRKRDVACRDSDRFVREQCVSCACEHIGVQCVQLSSCRVMRERRGRGGTGDEESGHKVGRSSHETARVSETISGFCTRWHETTSSAPLHPEIHPTAVEDNGGESDRA